MISGSVDTFYRSWQAKVTGLFLLAVAIWWVTIYSRGLTEGFENNLFTVTYPWIALWGGIWGLVAAGHWGGRRSVIGRAMLSLSIGILLQFVGQVAYSYYIYVLGIEVPYPSIGDFAYFGTSIFYIYGLALLAKAVGIRISMKSVIAQVQAVLIPLAMLVLAYFIFLQGYEFDWSQPLTIFLDFGYPTADAIYVSLAILIFTLSRKVLGGAMRGPILFLLVALIVESIADFTFPYQVSKDIWYVGGTNDFMYLLAYSFMAFALIRIGVSFQRLREGN